MNSQARRVSWVYFGWSRIVQILGFKLNVWRMEHFRVGLLDKQHVHLGESTHRSISAHVTKFPYAKTVRTCHNLRGWNLPGRIMSTCSPAPKPPVFAFKRSITITLTSPSSHTTRRLAHLCPSHYSPLLPRHTVPLFPNQAFRLTYSDPPPGGQLQHACIHRAPTPSLNLPGPPVDQKGASKTR